MDIVVFYCRIIILQAVLLMVYFLYRKKTRGIGVKKSLDNLGPGSIILIAFPFLGIFTIIPWIIDEYRKNAR